MLRSHVRIDARQEGYKENHHRHTSVRSTPREIHQQQTTSKHTYSYHRQVINFCHYHQQVQLQRFTLLYHFIRRELLKTRLRITCIPRDLVRIRVVYRPARPTRVRISYPKIRIQPSAALKVYEVQLKETVLRIEQREAEEEEGIKRTCVAYGIIKFGPYNEIRTVRPGRCTVKVFFHPYKAVIRVRSRRNSISPVRSPVRSPSPSRVHLVPHHQHKSPRLQPKSPRHAHKSPRHVHKSPRDVHKSPRHVHKSPRDVHKSPRHVHKSSRDVKKSPRDFADHQGHLAVVDQTHQSDNQIAKRNTHDSSTTKHERIKQQKYQLHQEVAQYTNQQAAEEKQNFGETQQQRTKDFDHYAASKQLANFDEFDYTSTGKVLEATRNILQQQQAEFSESSRTESYSKSSSSTSFKQTTQTSHQSSSSSAFRRVKRTTQDSIEN